MCSKRIDQEETAIPDHKTVLDLHELFVSECGTKFAVKEFPGSTRVHAGPVVPVHLTFEEQDEYDPCIGETYTVNVIRMWPEMPGLAELPCLTTSDKVHQVLRELVEKEARYSQPTSKNNLFEPRQILRSLWERVHRSPDE